MQKFHRASANSWLVSWHCTPPLHQKVYGWCPRNLFEFLYSHWSNSFGKFHYSINGLPPKPILIEVYIRTLQVHLFFYKELIRKFIRNSSIIVFSEEKIMKMDFFYKCQRIYIYLGKNLVLSDRNWRKNDFSIFYV